MFKLFLMVSNIKDHHLSLSERTRERLREPKFGEYFPNYRMIGQHENADVEI